MSDHEFSFKRDFKKIKWRSTLLLTFIRTVTAGLIWGIIGLIFFENTLYQSFALFVGVPLIFIPFVIFINILSKIGFPFIGAFTIPLSIFVISADPILYLVHKTNPSLIPVKEYGLLNFELMIFVIEDEIEHEEVEEIDENLKADLD